MVVVPAVSAPQLRLDFLTFEITGPSEDASPVTQLMKNSGVVADDPDEDGVPVTAVGQCLTDAFSVSNSDGPNPPTICGTNTDQHSESVQ